MKQFGLFSRTAALAFTALAALSACSKDNKQNVSISGSTTVIPVISRAAEDYMLDNKDVRIVVNAGGSGVGIKQVGEGQTDIGMTSRDITEDEYTRFADANLTTHTIGRDAVVPVISSEIYDGGVTALTLAQVASIYRGEVSNWSELGGPDKEIYVIDKEASRGTRQVFMKFVMGDKNADAPAADAVLGSNNEEQTAMAQSDAAIGMLSHAWVNDDVKGLAIILDDGTAVEPTIENIKNGRYPIIRDLLLVSRADISETASAFLAYIQGPEGQKIVEASGYIKIAE